MARRATINKGTPYETQLTLPEPNQWFRTDDTAHAFRVENGELVAYNLIPGRDPRLKDAPPEARGNLPYFNESDIRTVVEGGGGRTGTSFANEAYPEFFKKPEPEKGEMKEFTTPSGVKVMADPIEEDKFAGVKSGIGSVAQRLYDESIKSGKPLDPAFLKAFPQYAQGGGGGTTLAPPDPHTIQQGNAISPAMRQAMNAQGLDDATIATMDNTQQVQFGVFALTQQKNIDQSKQISEANIQTIKDALKTAADDPLITSKYGDALAIAKDSFARGMSDLNFSLQQFQKTAPYDLQKQRDELSNAEAAAGRAYSGFRQQAESRLKTEQSGIVESTRRETQKKLQDMGIAYEKVYGKATPPVSVPFTDPLTKTTDTLSYAPLGLVGNIDQQKQADITQRAEEIAKTRITP